MTVVLVTVALLVGLGAAVAVAGRVPRLAILGLVLVLAGAPFVADPAPSVAATAARVVAGILAGYVAWVAVRGHEDAETGSALGWPGVLGLATAVFAAGWLAATGVGASLPAGDAAAALPARSLPLASGSAVARAAFAAALATGVLGSLPVLRPRTTLGLGTGLLLLLAAGGLLASALGATDDATTGLLALVTAALGLAVAGIVRRSVDLHGDLGLHEAAEREPAVRSAPGPAAHPPAGARRPRGAGTP